MRGHDLPQAPDLWDYRGVLAEPNGVGGSIRRALRPNWVILVLSLVCAVVFGGIGAFVVFVSGCRTTWGGGQDCSDYSALGIAVADLLAWPIILFDWILSRAKSSGSGNGELIQSFWWIAASVLWAYYYLIVAVLRAFRSWGEMRNAPLSLK